MTSTSVPQPPQAKGLKVLVVLSVLALIALLLAQLMSALQSGGTASPPPSSRDDGDAREARMRQKLSEDWEQPLGEKDTEIAKTLRIQNRPCADFVGTRGDGEYLIAESKGSDIGGAIRQIENTLRALRTQGVEVKSVELRIYFKPDVWERLTSTDSTISNYGYKVAGDTLVKRTVDGQLVEAVIDGIKVLGYLIP